VGDGGEKLNLETLPDDEGKMKAVILAGGRGTRISEETLMRPKPMVELGGKPILWHIMKIYSHYGINDFVICVGYKGYLIKEFFANYQLHSSDVTIDFRSGTTTIHHSVMEPWTVTLVETGEDTMTGGRLARVRRYVENEEAFCFTYGDGLTNANLRDEIAFHRERGLLATVLAIQPPGRFGQLTLSEQKIVGFNEKPEGDGAWINGGYFILSPKVIDYVAGDEIVWERQPVERLAAEGQLAAYLHRGFWQPMDTLRDKEALEALWAADRAPWKVWS
jgi:glucose-1-phosphate cytidylyltransferase